MPDVAACVRASAHKATLALRDDPNPARDRIAWKWKSATTVAPDDYGDPTTIDAYALCVFDRPGGAASGVLALQVSAAGTCGTRPCWKAFGRGFKYNDPSMAADGIRSIQLKSGAADRAKANVKGKGAGLAMSALGLDSPVTARLVRIGAGPCWEATFGARHAERRGDVQGEIGLSITRAAAGRPSRCARYLPVPFSGRRAPAALRPMDSRRARRATRCLRNQSGTRPLPSSPGSRRCRRRRRSGASERRFRGIRACRRARQSRRPC